MSAVATVRWKYEPDENPKRRHHWPKDCAGFVTVQGVKVGKCPNNLTLGQAETLINQGVAFWPPRHREAWPKRIYVVHEGVVYRATPTVPGVSYHGFPETPEELRRLPSATVEAILEKAQLLGCEDQVRRWMNS